jgi:NAD-reducing hydrogenase small subunit
MSAKIRLATVWLDGCSGCHMSLLDMDERLLDIADRIELVSSPLMDVKGSPRISTSPSSRAPSPTRRTCTRCWAFRKNTKLLLALGDCAVTSNVPGMRNAFSVDELRTRAYIENASTSSRCRMPWCRRC